MKTIDFEKLAEDIAYKVNEVLARDVSSIEPATAAVLKLLRPLREAMDKNWTAPMAGSPINRPGYDALWGWFGLSYASWLTMPRVLMHEMPDAWQGKMAALLAEYNEAFSNWPDSMGSQVRVTMCGRLVKTPDWLINYRRPDQDEIKRVRGRQDKAA